MSSNLYFISFFNQDIATCQVNKHKMLCCKIYILEMFNMKKLNDDNNVFSSYGKSYLEYVYNDIQKCREDGTISKAINNEAKKLKNKYIIPSIADCRKMAEMQFFDEISKRYFEEE